MILIIVPLSACFAVISKQQLKEFQIKLIVQPYMQKALIATSQIRAARVIICWFANDLADKSGIGISTIKHFEVMDGIPSINISTMIAIKRRLRMQALNL